MMAYPDSTFSNPGSDSRPMPITCDLDCCCEKGEVIPPPGMPHPQFVRLPVENARSFYRFAVCVRTFERLRQQLAVLEKTREP